MRVRVILFGASLVLTLLFLSAQVTDLVHIPCDKKKNIDWQKIEFIDVGYLNVYDSLDRLELIGITQIDFDKVAKVNDSTFDASTLFKSNKKEFQLETSNSIYKFDFKNQKSKKRGKTWGEYIGYNSAISGYFIGENSQSGALEFGNLIFLDSISSKGYRIVSIGDGRVENPIFSENNRYFTYFYNEFLGTKSSFIGIVKLDEGNRENKYLVELSSFQSDSIFVNDIRWSGDSVLVLNMRDVDTNQTYYKATIF